MTRARTMAPLLTKVNIRGASHASARPAVRFLAGNTRIKERRADRWPFVSGR
jgi:hypothetical protein